MIFYCFWSIERWLLKSVMYLDKLEEKITKVSFTLRMHIPFRVLPAIHHDMFLNQQYFSIVIVTKDMISTHLTSIFKTFNVNSNLLVNILIKRKRS